MIIQDFGLRDGGKKKSYHYKVRNTIPIKGGKHDQAMNQLSSSSGAL